MEVGPWATRGRQRVAYKPRGEIDHDILHVLGGFEDREFAPRGGEVHVVRREVKARSQRVRVIPSLGVRWGGPVPACELGRKPVPVQVAMLLLSVPVSVVQLQPLGSVGVGARPSVLPHGVAAVVTPGGSVSMRVIGSPFVAAPPTFLSVTWYRSTNRSGSSKGKSLDDR